MCACKAEYIDCNVVSRPRSFILMRLIDASSDSCCLETCKRLSVILKRVEDISYLTAMESFASEKAIGLLKCRSVTELWSVKNQSV